MTPVDARGSFGFEVAATRGQTTTTTTYSYDPPDPGIDSVQQLTGPLPVAGLYLNKVVTKSGNAPPVTFQPAERMLFFQIPAANGNSWTVSGTDPATGQTLSYAANQSTNVRVDACGEVIDSVALHLEGQVRVRDSTQPVQLDPGTRSISSFTADYALALQYGGISVQDKVIVSGTDSAGGFRRENAAVINLLPKAPA